MQGRWSPRRVPRSSAAHAELKFAGRTLSPRGRVTTVVRRSAPREHRQQRVRSRIGNTREVRARGGGGQRSPRARRAPGRYQWSPRSRLPEKSDSHDQKNRPGVTRRSTTASEPQRSKAFRSPPATRPATPTSTASCVPRSATILAAARTPISQVTPVLLPGHRALREISVVAISGPALTPFPGGRASCRSPRASTHRPGRGGR